MIHRFFDALDGALSAIVPLLYLIGLAAGTLAYFSGLVLDFNVAVGICLAVAAECHSYLVQRRMRMARARLNRVQVSDAAYGQLEAQYKRQRNILVALLGFSLYNSVQFVASTWTPTGWLPGPVQIFARGAIVPLLFYLAGELTPIITDPADVVAHASRDMTFAAVRTMTAQWRRRLRRARSRNLDMAPIAVALLHDAGDLLGAQRIRMIAEGLTAAEEGRMPLPVMANDTARVVEATPAPSQRVLGGLEQPETPEDPHPTGPGSPVQRRVRTPRRSQPKVLRLRNQPVEERAAAVWSPGMSVKALEKAAGISRSSAQKYHAKFTERAQTQAQAQQVAQ